MSVYLVHLVAGFESRVLIFFSKKLLFSSSLFSETSQVHTALLIPIDGLYKRTSFLYFLSQASLSKFLANGGAPIDSHH